MTTPPDRTFADVLSNLPENNVGSITPADVGAIANLAKTSTFHDGAAGTGDTAFKALITRYVPAGSSGTADDIYHARLMDVNSATTGGGGTNTYRSASGDLSGTENGVQYAASTAQPRVFTYSWDLAVRSGKQSFWAVTFYYLPAGTAWPLSPTTSTSTVDSNWDSVKVHHSEPFWANSPVEYGPAPSTVEWVSETSGSRTVVLEPGDTVVPVVEYWGSGTAGDDPSSMDTSLIKWSLDVVSGGVAGTVPQDDAQYWETVSNRASVEALLNQTSSVDTAAAMTSRPIFIDDVTASQLPVTSDVLAGTTVYLTGEKRMFTYRGGGALTDWVEVANLNTAFNNRRPVVAEPTSSLTTFATAGNYGAGALAYDTTDYGLKVWDGTGWLAFATRQSGGKYPRIISAATGSLPAATAVAPGTVLFDETTKELKVSDGTSLLTVRDLDLATSGSVLPGSGTVGQQFYLTSGTQQGLYTYTSATAGVGWTKPWHMPWGVLAAVTVGSDQGTSATGITTAGFPGTAMTGFDSGVIPAMPAGRRLKISFRASIKQFTGPAVQTVTLRKSVGGGAVGDVTRLWSQEAVPVTGGSGTGAATVSGFHVETSLAGTHQYTCSLHASANTVSVLNTVAGGLLVVEDIGPAASPA